MANSIFSERLVCTPKNRTANGGDYKRSCSRRPWRLTALKRDRIFEVRSTEPDFLMEFRTKMGQWRLIEVQLLRESTSCFGYNPRQCFGASSSVAKLVAKGKHVLSVIRDAAGQSNKFV